MWLTRTAITRPVTILMLVLALVIMGWQSRSMLPVDLYPDIQLPMLFISTIYPGTGPEEMETLVSKPVEDAVSTISGLKKLSSTSSESASNVMMEFEIGTNLDEVASDVRSKLDALRNALPEDAKAPIVMKLDLGAMPVVQLSASSERREAQEVRRIADDVIKDRLSQLAGVATVSVNGGDVREIRIEVDKARLEAYNLGINQVVSALNMENLNLPTGSIKEELRNYAVRVMGEFENPEQIYGVRIASARDPNLTVRDVVVPGGVRDTQQEPTSYNRMNRGSSVNITVQKQSNGNTVKVVEAVRKELNKLTGRDYVTSDIGAALPDNKVKTQPVLPDDYQITVAFDQSTFIKEALHDVNESLLIGALLAVLIVFLFLHSLRGTFIVGLAIPTSMIATFLVMRACGFSINMMSMLGLSLSVGILVDDSIVVIENIHRHLKKGAPPKEAALKGRMEIGLAAMTIALVDVVVFVPIAFMGGIVGQMFRQFGIVIATATLFSLFVSFTLTPMLASRWLKAHDQEEEEEARQAAHPGLFRRFSNAWERSYQFIEHIYRQVLAWALDHRPVVICLGVMTMLASIASAQPKTPFMDVLVTLPAMLLVLGVIALIWFGVRYLHGALRALGVLLGLPLSIAFSVIAMHKVGGSFLQILFLVILSLGMLAFTLSLPRRAQPGVNLNAVLKPLSIWTALLLLFVAVVPTKFAFEFRPDVDQRQFTITVEQEVGTPLAVTDQTVQLIESVLDPATNPEIKIIMASVGTSGGRMFSAGSTSADTASITVGLKDMDDVQGVSAFKKLLAQLRLIRSPLRTTDEVVADINQRFSSLPGVKVTAAISSSGPGGAPITLKVSGPDMASVQSAAERIAAIVRDTEGTYATELSWREGRPEFQARIDRDRAAQYGISVAQIASALRTSMEGDTSTKYREGGKEYDIRVVLPQEQRQMLAQVSNMIVGVTPDGQPVTLTQVVTPQLAGGPTKIERTDRQRSVTVSAQLREGVAIGNIRGPINEQLKALDLHGATLTWAGQAEMMDEAGGNLGSALLLSIALVFMLMAALFESILAPLIIMLSVPMAMAGAIFALTITQKSLSIVSMIGIILLVGLVTKNAILLVDYTNTLRKEEGMERRQALLQAGPIRLQPILMTTLAMIFGMMPTAIAFSKGAEFRQPMAIAVIGGLILSLFLTLLMVPVFYEILDDVAERFARARDRLVTRLRL